jgi:excisionase family DNA binding protein
MNRQVKRNGQRLVYSVEEARQLLGVGKNQCYDAIKRGEIPHIKLGAHILIPKAPFHKLLDEGATAPSPAPVAQQAKRGIERASDASAA